MKGSGRFIIHLHRDLVYRTQEQQQGAGMRHIPQLDGIRTIAVSLVLLTHFWTYPSDTPIFNRLAATGWIGVDLFFVLSGYLITRILLEARDRPHYFRDFYVRRSLRIFPAYFALLAVVLLGLPLVSSSPELAQVQHDAWLYVLYLSNFAIASGGWILFATDITWSLAIEEQFYLVWPTLVKWTSRLVPVCIGIILALPVVRFAMWEAGVDWKWLHMMMPLRADGFAFGALLALWRPKGMLWLALACLAVLTGLVLTGHFLRHSALVNTVGYTLTSLTAACVIGCALECGRFKRFLSWRPVAHVGKVSYGVYLYHPLCLIAATALLPPMTGVIGGVMRIVVVSALAVGVATASFYLYERPFLKLKDRFAGSPAAVSSPAIPSR